MKTLSPYGLLAALALCLCSCQSATVKISGRFVGSAEPVIYLEQVTPLAQTLVDSARLDADGGYAFEIHHVDQTPALYNVLYGGERIPLFLSGGDRLTVSAVGRVVPNYTVTGSKESELLRLFYQPYVAGVRRLSEIAGSVGPDDAEELRRTMAAEYWDEYVRIKQEQIRFIVEHKASLAAVYALYQRLPGDRYLASMDSDVIYYRMVADAVEESYPESSYLPQLSGEIARMDARANLIAGFSEIDYPEVTLPDMFGKPIALSSLQGMVILVDFWSAELGTSNALNADMKPVYERFADRGFEIYQIGVDRSRSEWIDAVQEQALPWISVSDCLGRKSPAVGMFNVQKLPSNFLIDAEGNIVGRDLYGAQLEEALEKLFD